MQQHFFLSMRQSLFFFSGAGKFCLAHGLRQLTPDTKSDVSCIQTFFTNRNEKRRMTFGVGRHTTFIVIILFKTSIFPVIGKKNNQTSLFGADQELPTLGLTDVRNVSALSVYPRVGISRSAPKTNDRFYFICFKVNVFSVMLFQG